VPGGADCSKVKRIAGKGYIVNLVERRHAFGHFGNAISRPVNHAPEFAQAFHPR
jgi:hypothetical protein